MDEEDKPNGVMVPRTIAARLVVGLHSPETEAIPGSHGRVVHLEQPKSQPAAIEGNVRELPVNRLAIATETRVVASQRAECSEELVEIIVEPPTVVSKAEAHVMLATQPARDESAPALCEVPAKDVVPGLAAEGEDRAAGPGGLPPRVRRAVLGGDVLANEQ